MPSVFYLTILQGNQFSRIKFPIKILYAGYSARVEDIINRVCLKPGQLIVFPGHIIIIILSGCFKGGQVCRN
ncbi:MAG TPA: hypothetical protein DDZ44_01415 [Syntrophomonas wolfei]|uniref:Uncharacterized protein n=1 Tax=Syntrophomonas wolfei TaxID=863 RepID=A0A354YTR2_9FIRM|nr:hypothetical protein [Syntrophomonas wolfei]